MNSNSPSSLLKSVAENAALNRAEKEIATSLAQNTSLEEKTTKIQNLIYELLTTHPDFYLGSRRDANFLVDFHRQHIEHRNYYNTLLNALEKKYHTSSNWKWLQIQCTNFPKNPEGYTFKIYKTLDIQKLEVLNLYTIDWLYQRLQKIGNLFQSRVSFKIPGNFILLASHNDRLVIHFSDQHCISAIQNILAEWEREMGMPMLDRSYSRTEIAADRHDTSFSDFIAQHYANELVTGKHSISQILRGAIESSKKTGFSSKKSS